MKKLIVCSLAMVFCSALVFAHPPKSIDVKVDKNNINIVVVHNTRDITGQYIETIEVSLNSKKMIIQRFSSRADASV